MGLIVSKIDREIFELVQRAGFAFRKPDGDAWLQGGQTISKEKFDRLIALDLVEGVGDAMFDLPSQTWKAKEKSNV